MNTLEAFAIAESARAAGAEKMVFDWDKAAQIIKDRKAKSASAGLAGDWEWTGGDILREGKPVSIDETYVYLASLWATPQLKIDDEVIACYRMVAESPGWDESTYWPKSALEILEVEL